MNTWHKEESDLLNCKTETEAEKTVMSVKRQVLRNNEYYGTQNTLDGLYAQSKRGKVFTDLMLLIAVQENILLAYRNIKNNKGSNTAGVDKKTIASLEKLDSDKFVSYIQNCLNDNELMPVRRVEIPKPNGKKRPLGIPTIRDRIIQQSIKQIIEPIAEAKYVAHSYVLDKAVDRIIKDVKQQSRKIPRSKNPVKEIGKLNSYILGVHNYYKYATCCNKSFSKISSQVRTTVKKGIGIC